MPKQKWEFRIHKSEKNGQYYTELVSIVGGIEEQLMSSAGELFTQKHNAFGNIASVKKGAVQAEIIDMTGEESH